MLTQRSPSQRIFGLDVMRALAIIQVVYSHSLELLRAHWPPDLSVSFVDGVDLFFVLSGFLVGGILLRSVEENKLPWYKALLDFWQRRWLRTLPNYYLFLFVNIALAYAGVTRGVLHTNTWAYFLFFQNFHIQLGLMFWESWSLAVEEWFYLLFPIAVLGVLGLIKLSARYAFLLATMAMIIFPTVIRFSYIDGIDTLFQQDLIIRKLVVNRLDTIGFGVLAAWIHHYYYATWSKLKWVALIVGVVGYWLATVPWTMANVAYLSTWYFTFMSIALAMTLPVLSSWNSISKYAKPVEFLSRISYALYLVHLPLRYFFLDAAEGLSMAGTVLLYAGFWATSILAAAAVYRWFELPFMRLRGKISERLR
ncbi:MAG: acyltransferase [Flavobacteriales bacterium]|jgi:peptidoglycan/LPS O-acetylase OafA/YrhL|nr:acyltransferase [Flavobacteriales bacterium]